MSDSAFAAVATRARSAATDLALATRAAKDAALEAMADALLAEAPAILAANRCRRARRPRLRGTPEHLLDRLRLDDARVAGMAQGLRDVAGLPDPVGEVLRGSTLANGLQLRQVRVPVRRGRHHLRGPAQRDRRRRRHLPEERQRGAAARLLQRAALQQGDRRSAPPGGSGVRPPRGRRPAGAGRGPRLGQGADAGPRPGRRADPARRRRPDPPPWSRSRRCR